MVAYNQTVVLNGQSDFNIFGRDYEWDDGFIGRLRARLDDGDTGRADLVLRGNWDIDMARFNGSPPARVDLRDGGGGERYITHLRLPDGPSELTLPVTQVAVVRGYGTAGYDLALGRFVDAVLLGDGDDLLRVEEGGLYANLSGGDNTVMIAGGNLQSVKFDSGDNRLFVQPGGRFETARANDGDNYFELRDGFGSLTFGSGSNEVVFTQGFGAAITGYSDEGSVNRIALGGEAELRSLGLSNGRDTVVLNPGARINQADLGANADEVILGEGARLDSLHLGNGENVLRVNGGEIQQVYAYEHRDVAVLNGGRVDQLNLGGGNNAVAVNGGGRINALTTYDGDDVIRTNAGRIDVVMAGSGDNTVVTANEFVNGIYAYEGNDSVQVGTGGAGMVKLDDGDNSVTAAGFVDAVVLFDGADRVSLSGGAGSVNTGRGADVIELLGAGAGYVSAGDGDDLIRVTRLGAEDGARINGGRDIDTLDLGGMGAALTVDLGRGAAFQNVAAPGGDLDAAGRGYLSIGGIERLLGGDAGDALSGGRGDETLEGRGGRDTLAGRDGDDLLLGGAGRDIFVFDRDDGTDTVGDFELGADLIRLEGVTSARQVSFDQRGDDVEVGYFDTTILVRDITVGELAVIDNFDV